MQIETSRFGTLDIEESKIISFPDGILGFADRRFIMLTPPAAAPFCWLQSVDAPEIAFVVVEPTSFFPDYTFRLTRDEVEKLRLAEGEETLTLVLVTMAVNPAEITANLLGPVVINVDGMTAKQIVLEGTKFSTKAPLFVGGQLPVSVPSDVIARVAAEPAAG